MQNLFLIFVAAWGLTPCAFAQISPQCLEPRQVKSVEADFEFQVAPDAASSLSPCKSDPLTLKVYQAILFIKNLPKLTIQLDQYDQGILQSTPYQFLKERIRTIRFESDNNLNCQNGTVAAYVKPNEQAIMHICSGSQDGDLLIIASTLIHEARHTQGYPHTSFCAHGRLAGGVLGGCDAAYSGQGAYALEVEFNIRIARTLSLPKELRDQARNLAAMTLLENINETPFHIRAGYFLQSDSNEVTFFDGSTQEPLLQLENPDDLFLLRSQVPTVYSYKSGEVTSFLNAKDRVKTPGIYSELFRSYGSEAERREVLDISYYKLMSCILFKNRLRCGQGSNESELKLESIHPTSLTVLANTLAVIDTDGYAYPIPRDSIGKPSLQESSLSPTSRPIGVISLAEESLLVHYGVDPQGVVRRYTALGDPEIPGIPVAGLAQQRFKKIIGPIWWSSEVSNF